MQKKYEYLLKDKNLRRWYENMSRGSPTTADVYLRRLGNFYETYKITPQELIKMEEKRISDLLLDVVADMENKQLAGSYIASALKAIKSWLAFNDRQISK